MIILLIALDMLMGIILVTKTKYLKQPSDISLIGYKFCPMGKL
jgi:hypothetical protein